LLPTVQNYRDFNVEFAGYEHSSRLSQQNQSDMMCPLSSLFQSIKNLSSIFMFETKESRMDKEVIIDDGPD
jgi:hypothetical protein